MKKTILLTTLIALIIGGNVNAQSYTILNFRKPTAINSTTFKFTHVAPGVDAIISIIDSKNASLNSIDDSSIYPLAWNPYINYGKASSSSDSSYLKFNVRFVLNGTNTAYSIKRFAMTAVDLDGSGSGSFREMFSVPSSVTPRAIVGSSVTKVTGIGTSTFIGSSSNFSNTDTVNYIAMTQADFSNTSSYNMMVGIVGRQSGSNATRQYSFYFKPFSPLNIVLPVEMIDLNAGVKNGVNTISWKTTSEENAQSFEIYRSADGINFELAGSVNAAGHSNTVNAYEYADNSVEAGSSMFYRLKVIDIDGSSDWSNILYIAASTNKTFGVASVYPNPCNGVLNLNLNSVSEAEITVEVVDAFGKTLKSVSSEETIGLSTISFDLTDLNSGVYFVKVTAVDGQSDLHKFIKK